MNTKKRGLAAFWQQEKKDIRVVLLDVVILFFIIWMLIAASVAGSEIAYVLNDQYSFRAYMNCYSQGDYGRMVEMYHYDAMYGTEPRESAAEFVAFAKYYEADSWYKVYKEKGDTEGMKEQQAIMDQNLARISTLPDGVEKVEELFLQ